ncbi:hypothetical protein Tco_1480514, partial [Tanacetum coccineum]
EAYAITLPLCISTHPKPWHDASQYTMKSSGPSGRARTGALHNLSFKLIEYVIYPREGMTALDGQLIQFSIIDAHPKRIVLLLDE